MKFIHPSRRRIGKYGLNPYHPRRVIVWDGLIKVVHAFAWKGNGIVQVSFPASIEIVNAEYPKNCIKRSCIVFEPDWHSYQLESTAFQGAAIKSIVITAVIQNWESFWNSSRVELRLLTYLILTDGAWSVTMHTRHQLCGREPIACSPVSRLAAVLGNRMSSCRSTCLFFRSQRDRISRDYLPPHNITSRNWARSKGRITACDGFFLLKDINEIEQGGWGEMAGIDLSWKIV